jgi:hypothetical protein
MNRRRLLKTAGTAILLGSFPATIAEFLSSCKNPGKKQRADFFTDQEYSLVETIADLILPRTSTPGALDAQSPYFIELVVKNCLGKNDQQMIRDGLAEFEHDTRFSSLGADQKAAALKLIDENSFKDSKYPWYPVIKKLCLVGYFTSREGMTAALNYVKVPGDYKACIPYKKGDKALAKTFLMYW